MKRKVIAITGGIGSGKSAVSSIISAYGFEVVDCDKLSRQVATDKNLLNDVAKLLGNDCVVDGQLNRKLVRERVFCNDNLYQKYSNLFWNRIKTALTDIVEKANSTIFVEIPLISAFEFDWSEIWLVESSDETRIKRVSQRDNVSEQNVLDIMSRQQPTQHYTKKIVNDGSLDDLKHVVDVLLKELKLI